jgi:hypothetical protein
MSRGVLGFFFAVSNLRTGFTAAQILKARDTVPWYVMVVFFTG